MVPIISPPHPPKKRNNAVDFDHARLNVNIWVYISSLFIFIADLLMGSPYWSSEGRSQNEFSFLFFLITFFCQSSSWFGNAKHTKKKKTTSLASWSFEGLLFFLESFPWIVPKRHSIRRSHCTRFAAKHFTKKYFLSPLTWHISSIHPSVLQMSTFQIHWTKSSANYPNSLKANEGPSLRISWQHVDVHLWQVVNQG